MLSVLNGARRSKPRCATRSRAAQGCACVLGHVEASGAPDVLLSSLAFADSSFVLYFFFFKAGICSRLDVTKSIFTCPCVLLYVAPAQRRDTQMERIMTMITL